MRVLSVIHGPVFGGGFNQMAVLREPLQRRGWQLLAGVSSEPGNAIERLRDAGTEAVALDLHRLRATPDPRPHMRLAVGFRREVEAIRELIRKRGINLVQAHGDTNPHAAIAGHLEGAAVVWELYDTRTPIPMRRMTMPLVVRIADVITTWGDDLARRHPGATELGDRQVTVFPPVDSHRFVPDPGLRESARRKLGVADDALLVGTVGVRNPSKGHEWFVRAAEIVRRHHPTARFRVLGSSSPVHTEYANSVDREARERGLGDGILEFRDPENRVADLLPGFDMFVLTSIPRSEGMPTAIVEAMSCEVPVIATDVGAVREIIDDASTGLVVPPEDAEALASAISRLISEPELRGHFANAGRDRVMGRFDLERCADIRAHAFARAIKHRLGRPRHAAAERSAAVRR